LAPLFVRASLDLVERVSGISTTSGIVTGHTAANRTGVTEYLGIPYAAPTNGSQRWMPPQRFNSTKKFNASTYVSSFHALT
jgi:carboxylesterase type B